jgi:hypothetical protein
VRNALKHAARRSQRTTKQRYLRWNQANVRSAWKRGARRQRHASGVREAVDEDALAFAAIRNALTAACARGTMNHPRPRTAIESCRVPRPPRGAGLAWRPGYHRLASAAATDARRF